MKQKLLNIIHSLTDAGLQYAKDNPRNIIKVSAKSVAASCGVLGTGLAIHGWPKLAVFFAAIAAGAAAIDAYLSDSSSKGGDQ